MSTVFVVQHEHEVADEVDDAKFIGVYSSRETAEAAVQRLRHAPGFRDTPDCFYISEYRLDQDHWVEGYVTVVVGKTV
jgi:hypothetical protein